MYDAIVLGGGFYGVAIANYLKVQRGLRRIALVERESGLLLRASYNNQARIHNGYHYPRSFTTAFRSRVNLPRFVVDYGAAVRSDFTKVYAIARLNSKVTARKFERFCRHIGASLEPASKEIRKLFERRLIEDVFVAREYALDASRLMTWAERVLHEARVDVHVNCRAVALYKGRYGLAVECEGTTAGKLNGRYIFNCTYSGLNQLEGQFGGTQTRLKHEIAEIAMVKVPAVLTGIGITVMDGPFFSILPFPARALHTLSHVRYTPHQQWPDQRGSDPYRKLDAYDRETHVDRMIRDVVRYMPCAADVMYSGSLFEIKTVLSKNEGDDGRPILFEKHPELPGCYSILGGKIDNIYDVLEKLDAEPLSAVRDELSSGQRGERSA
jgi:glycine/D-amino acid oxidase-like deaminating enzyme